MWTGRVSSMEKEHATRPHGREEEESSEAERVRCSVFVWVRGPWQEQEQDRTSDGIGGVVHRAIPAARAVRTLLSRPCPSAPAITALLGMASAHGASVARALGAGRAAMFLRGGSSRGRHARALSNRLTSLRPQRHVRRATLLC